MKKVFFLFSLLLFSVAVFSQDLKDALVALGLNPTVVSLVLGLIALILGHVAVPQKWASILALLEAALHWINERTNRLSEKQVARKAAFDHELRLLKARGIIPFIALLLLCGSLQAQSPWGGFFKPSDVVVKQVQSRAEVTEATNVWLFRPAVSLTALAVDFSEKPVLSHSLSSLGFGLSYGRFTTVNEKAYCNLSVNGLLLTSVKLGDVESAAIGGAVTLGLFDQLLQVGVGYLDKSFMLLTGVAISF